MTLKRAVPHLSVLLCIVLSLSSTHSYADPIRVLVWDEEQPEQKSAYPNFLGKQIASHLEKRPELQVKTARMDDPEQGLSTQALDECDVLIWWGHTRHAEISDAKGRDIGRRVQSGQMAAIILHSAHFSVPFMELMERKAAQDAVEQLAPEDRARAKVAFMGKRERKMPSRDRRSILQTQYKRQSDGSILVELERPNCVFPSCCHPVEASNIRTLLPEHPIASGIPERFTIPATEMYDEPFGIPAPDQVVFEESWVDGEHFRSGAVWKIGDGMLFYFRPGHETYKIFFERYPLKILENATLWLGESILAHQGRKVTGAKGK